MSSASFGVLGEQRVFYPPLLSETGAPPPVSDVFDSPQQSEDYRDMFVIPGGGAPRRALAPDPAPPVKRLCPKGKERRPASSNGQSG